MRGQKTTLTAAALLLSLCLIVSVSVMLIAVLFLDKRLNREAAPDTYTPDPKQVLSPAPDTVADFESHAEDTEKDRAVRYTGDLELPVSGATGFAPVRMDMTSSASDSSGVLKILEPGAAFLILSEQGGWWEIRAGDVSGFVRHSRCMINLPDVIPSVIYDNTNSDRSKFTSSLTDIPNISGERLYFSKARNERLDKEEYIVAVMYPMSKKIYLAQQSALTEGWSLLIYEGFRPYSVQKKIAAELEALAQSNPDVYKGLNTAPWSFSWLIATGISSHQTGCAVDVSLARINASENMLSGNYEYTDIKKYRPGYMPTGIHELSAAAAAFAYPVSSASVASLTEIPLSDGMKESTAAQSLQKYCMDAGLTPLASEWWHFDDLDTKAGVPGDSRGDYILTDCYSVPPSTNIP